MSDQPSSRRQFLFSAAGALAAIPIVSHAAAPAAAPVPPGYESPSVVSPHLQHWGAQNLFVVVAATYPQHSGYNIANPRTL